MKGSIPSKNGFSSRGMIWGGGGGVEGCLLVIVSYQSTDDWPRAENVHHYCPYSQIKRGQDLRITMKILALWGGVVTSTFV